MQGGFSPLSGYMNQNDYQSVVNDLKLTNGKMNEDRDSRDEIQLTTTHSLLTFISYMLLIIYSSPILLWSYLSSSILTHT